ncbi:hypothetical protein [Leeia aquatica]|uniref:Uncharacterized protein n=1 Tax=Leeia aquatica TaxID=2725557 RepID=A0A847S6D6_9NEIS|nr:hypothetical protein [Leeia aquatica]NLR74375.1 hypothetical protein [Leeia aquatica]
MQLLHRHYALYFTAEENEHGAVLTCHAQHFLSKAHQHITLSATISLPAAMAALTRQMEAIEVTQSISIRQSIAWHYEVNANVCYGYTADCDFAHTTWTQGMAKAYSTRFNTEMLALLDALPPEDQHFILHFSEQDCSDPFYDCYYSELSHARDGYQTFRALRAQWQTYHH